MPGRNNQNINNNTVNSNAAAVSGPPVNNNELAQSFPVTLTAVPAEELGGLAQVARQAPTIDIGDLNDFF